MQKFKSGSVVYTCEADCGILDLPVGKLMAVYMAWRHCSTSLAVLLPWSGNKKNSHCTVWKLRS